MKLAIKTFGIVLLFGALGSASPSKAAGVKYEHKLEKSKFKLGAGERAEVQGPYQRLVGDRGAFMVDALTGATLATLSAPSDVLPRTAPPSAALPQPLTQDPEEHSTIVRDYLLGAGIPANEVSGTHVTTTMAGGGPKSAGALSTPSQLLWYTTHLERSLQGIPVEGSFAFAALDSNGEVITEGVYWPAIPDSVVSEALQLKRTLASPAAKAAFMQNVEAARPDAKDAVGEVKIVHTSAGYHGAFEAKGVYSTVVRSAMRGKASLVRFDNAGTPVELGDEQPNGTDSVKRGQ